MEDNIQVNCFKIIPFGINRFKGMVKKYSTLRFTQNPSYEEDYILMSFSVNVDEYDNLLNECINKGVYYYA